MEIVEKTLKLLKDNESEWVENWKKYAVGTRKNLETIEERRAAFKEWEPLRVYTNILHAYKKGERAQYPFSLRFKGREVGLVKVATGPKGDKYQVTLSLEGKTEDLRKKLEVPVGMNDYPWDSTERKQFRKHFIDNKDTLKIDEDEQEATIESLILDEMQSKQRSKFNGTLKNIQPVRVADKCRFQMPVPLSANTGTPENTKGNIDILARIVAEGAPYKEARLSVLELKKNSTASYKHALAQSAVYSLCIHALVRNPEMGESWWKIFGYQGNLPEKLTLYSVAMIPEDLKSYYVKEAKSLGITQSKDHISLGDDTIKFGYAFFSQENGGISITDYSWKDGGWQAIPC